MPDTNRDILIRHVSDRIDVHPRPDPVWQFAPLPGTQVVFRSGPRARIYAPALTGLQMTWTERCDDGFDAYQLEL